MKYLFDEINQALRLISCSRRILLLFDYDGTLTPIVGHPKDALLDNRMRFILKRLNAKKFITVGIISGRKIKELKRLVQVKGVYYAGNHGFEIKGPGINFFHPKFAQFKPHIKKIGNKLATRLGNIKGAIVEDKGFSLSLHYRLVDKNQVSKVTRIFKEIISSYVKKRHIRITFGKKVLEVRPPLDWDKGKAVKLIEKLNEKLPNSLTVYMGDDKTDEDAFKVLRKKGISIFVGKPSRSSHARYYLKNTTEAAKFLKQILLILN